VDADERRKAIPAEILPKLAALEKKVN